MIKKIAVIFLAYLTMSSFILGSQSQTLISTNEHHYLDKLFGINSFFHKLPLDVQYHIVSYLPNPLRPIKLSRFRALHKREKGESIWKPRITSSGSALFMYSGFTGHDEERYFYTESLDGTTRTTKQVFHEEVVDFILCDEDSTLIVLSEQKITIITMANYVFARHADFHFQNHPPYCTQLAQTPTGDILLVGDAGKVLLFSRKKARLTDFSYHETEKDLSTKAMSNTICVIHPEGQNVLYLTRDASTAIIFDLETRTWSFSTDLVALPDRKFSEVQYNSDGTLLLTCEDHLMPSLYDPDRMQLAVWSYNGRTFSKQTNVLRSTWLQPSSFPSPAYFSCSEESDIHYLYSATSMRPLLRIPGHCNELHYRWCLLDKTNTSLVSVKTFTEERYTDEDISIWKIPTPLNELNQFYSKKRTLRQYLLLTYLHILGSYGITVNEHGLVPLEKYQDRISIQNSNFSRQDIQDLMHVKHSLEEDAVNKKYLDNKYPYIPTKHNLTSAKKLTLLLIAGALGYTLVKRARQIHSKKGPLPRKKNGINQALGKTEKDVAT